MFFIKMEQDPRRSPMDPFSWCVVYCSWKNVCDCVEFSWMVK